MQKAVQYLNPKCIINERFNHGYAGKVQTPTKSIFVERQYDRSNRNATRVLERFRLSGTSCNLSKGRSDCRITERCLENIQAVCEALENQGDGARRKSPRRNGVRLTFAT